MDENLLRLNKLFPNCGYVQIRKYEPELWRNREYDSRLENKAPMTQWRTSPLTFQQACEYAERGFRIGWILPEGYVCVDVDNEDNEESSAYIERILIDNNVKYAYNRTSRGVHFFFQDRNLAIPSDAVTKCALGVTVDHRANRKGYVILPTNDPNRSWGDWPFELDDIPFYLKPLMAAKNQIETFIGLDSPGRNDALFKWRSKLLQSNKLTNEEIRESLILINKYLLRTPMDEREMLASVTKERATDREQREKGERQKLNVLEKPNIYNEIANKITREFDLMNVGGEKGVFYRFENSHYKSMETAEMEKLIHYEISENIPSQGRKEIMKFVALKTLTSMDDIDCQWNKIAVANGVLDLVTGELSEPDPNEKNTIAIPWRYNPDPIHSPKIDEFMAHISADYDGTVNVMKQQFLYQIAGYCLLKQNFFHKFFIFQGDGGTGKSTFQNLIVKLVGKKNCSHVALDKMDNDYFLATLMGKLVNIDDDAVDGKILAETGRFKSIVAGEPIEVRQIFSAPVTYVSYTTLMFSCNKLPRIQDKTDGLYRRMVIIELNNKVLKPDPLFIMKLTSVDMEYFLYKAVYWLGVAFQEGKFRISQSEQELLRKFRCRQSSLNEWLYSENMSLGDIYNKPVSALYTFYVEWATQNGYSKFPSSLSFKEDICALYEVEIGYTGEDRRASSQVFTRRKEPTLEQLRSVPF